MRMSRPLHLSEEVGQALQDGQPVVALESTVIAHGLPYPTNLECARQMEATVRRQGAVPATIALLTGQIPLRPHQTAFLQREPGTGDPLVHLNDAKGRVVEKIYLDSQGQGRVRRIEMFDNGNTLLYGVDFSGSLDASGYRLPAQLTVSNAGKPVFLLRIERCWINPEVAEETFRLAPGAKGH